MAQVKDAPVQTEKEAPKTKISGSQIIARSLKEQGVEYMFGIVGIPVMAKGRHSLYRVPERAGGELRGWRRGLYDRPSRRVSSRIGSGNDSRDRRTRERVVECLADDPSGRRK